MVIFSQPRGDREEQPCHAWQAVCGTTHKGSWVKLLLCFISIQWHGRVRISERDKSNPGIKTPLPFLSFSEKHYGRERLGGFSRSHNACYWLHKAISMSLSWFGDDRRSILSILRSCFSEDFMYCFVHMYIMFISEWKRSVVHTWICLSKNIHPLVVFIYLMDFTTGKEGSASKQQGEKSSLIAIYFHRQVYIILQAVPVWNPHAQINLLLGKEKTDRKSRTATAQWKFPKPQPQK